jgi:predicted RNase H-like nuclease (RuvC/YqgF family)
MNEQDLKYLITSYQQKSFDLFSQSVATDAKIRQLTDLIESLNTKIKEQQEELDKLSTKPKRTSQKEDFS